jgi:hypothetical protein
LHEARIEICIVGFAQRSDFKPFTDYFASLTQAVGVTDHQRIADRACFGFANAFIITSGPIPAGSPMVIAIVGRVI